MSQPDVRWGALVAGIATTMGTLIVLATIGSGQWGGDSVGVGFLLLVLLACASAWFIADALVRNGRLFAHLVPRMARFAAVGVMTTVIDLGVLNILLYIGSDWGTHEHLFPVFATISFICSTLNSFYWNRTWTFRGHEGRARQQLPSFYFVTLISFAINVGLSSALVWWHPFPWIPDTLWANVAKMAASGVSMLLNFTGYHRFVFKDRT